MSDTSSATGRVVVRESPSAFPCLATAPRLIHALGFCISVASTPEVSRISLATETLEHVFFPLALVWDFELISYRSSDLSTNLVQIADEGQNAYLDAYSNLLDIANGTHAMSKDGGFVGSSALAGSRRS